MWKVGDKVICPYCDSQDNQEIIGKTVTVTTAPDMRQSPFWMEVERDGKKYWIRGSEARRG